MFFDLDKLFGFTWYTDIYIFDNSMYKHTCYQNRKYSWLHLKHGI